MAGKSERFTAYVYENDYTEIQKLVQHYPNIETGGDLFGLWQDDKSVVIQLFIGPGKGCKRTTTSFHQDVAYLQKVGTVITKEEGLCNVGEWHSHHQIGMPKPSGADKRTVLSNMPQLGLDRFVLFIASIESSEKKKRSRNIQLEDITLRCFMFREDLRHEEQPIEGKIVKIEEKNPVHLKYKARKQIKEGAEEPPPKEEALEKKQKQSKKQELLDSKPPARNQSGPRDENTSPNSAWKEKTSDQRTTDVSRQTTQPASPSYPSTQSPPRPNQDQVPSSYNQPHSSQGQVPPSQSQPRSNQGQVPPSYNQPHSSQGQVPPSQSQPRSSQGQVPPSYNQPRSSQGQVPPSQSQPRSNQGQVPSSYSQPRSNQGQVPSSYSQPHSDQGQYPSSQSQPRSNQAQSSSSQRQPRSSQGQDPNSQSQLRSNQAQAPYSQNKGRSNQGQGTSGQSLNPTAPNEVRIHRKGFF